MRDSPASTRPRSTGSLNLLDLRPGADLAAVRARLDAVGGVVDDAQLRQPPAGLDNLRGTRQAPTLLGGFLALLGTGALGHTLVSTQRRRRRDLAVLRALGLSARQTRAVVAWQATTVAVVGIVVEVPLGLLTGRLVWRWVPELTTRRRAVGHESTGGPPFGHSESQVRPASWTHHLRPPACDRDASVRQVPTRRIVPVTSADMGENDFVIEVPEVRFAKSGSARLAYQMFGEGPATIVAVPPFAQNIELAWESPILRRFLEGFAAFSRYLHFDKRGTGASDTQSDVPGIDERVDDLRAVSCLGPAVNTLSALGAGLLGLMAGLGRLATAVGAPSVS